MRASTTAIRLRTPWLRRNGDGSFLDPRVRVVFGFFLFARPTYTYAPHETSAARADAPSTGPVAWHKWPRHAAPCDRTWISDGSRLVKVEMYRQCSRDFTVKFGKSITFFPEMLTFKNKASTTRRVLFLTLLPNLHKPFDGKTSNVTNSSRIQTFGNCFVSDSHYFWNGHTD